MITDERLRAAAEKSSDLYLCCMEEGYDAIPPHEFSEPFERKIRKLKKRADHPYFYKMMHKVAVIILAVLIGGSAWLAVDTEARASFFGWVKEVYEELFIYHFEDGRTSNEGKNNYYLTWIPEGYTQILEDIVSKTSCFEKQRIFYRADLSSHPYHWGWYKQRRVRWVQGIDEYPYPYDQKHCERGGKGHGGAVLR